MGVLVFNTQEVMTEKQMKEWQYHNGILQDAYRKYCGAFKEKDKEDALVLIDNSLKWNPFMNYCYERSAFQYSIVRYGLDSITRQCIEDIDMIAHGQMEYNY